MFCTNCGKEMLVSNQKYCHECGSEIPTYINPPKLQKRKPNYELKPSLNPKHASRYPDVPDSWNMRKKRNGPAGPLSKRCLGYGITSLVIAAIGLILGSGIMFYSLIYYLLRSFTTSQSLILIVILIVIMVHILGLFLGIFSRLNSAKAMVTEPPNGAEKVGGVISVFGIVINIIGIVLVIVIFSLMLSNFSPYSNYYSYY